MAQAKLLKFKKSPTNFLFREIFNFEANYMYTAELPNFPKEFKVDTSDLKKRVKENFSFCYIQVHNKRFNQFKTKKYL